MKSVSNLLKIFSLWSDRPIYYPLFAIKCSNFDRISSDSLDFLNNSANFKHSIFKEKNIIAILFDLIDSDKCSQAVIEYVMDIVYNLVSYADFKPEYYEEEEQINTKPLPFNLDVLKNQFVDSTKGNFKLL